MARENNVPEDDFEMVDDDLDFDDEDEDEEPEKETEPSQITEIAKLLLRFFLKVIIPFVLIGLLLYFITDWYLSYRSAEVPATNYQGDVYVFEKEKSNVREKDLYIGKINSGLKEEEYSVVFDLYVGIKKIGEEGEEEGPGSHALAPYVPLIKNSLQDLLSQKSYENLNTSFKRNNFLKLQIENEINSILHEIQINSVYFSDFTIFKQMETIEP